MFKSGVIAAMMSLPLAVQAEPKECTGDNTACAGYTSEAECKQTASEACAWDTKIMPCNQCHTYTSALDCPDNSWFSWDDAKGCAWAIKLGEIGNENPAHACHADQRNTDLPMGAARCTGPLGDSEEIDDTHNEKIGEEIGNAIAGWLIAVIAIGVGIPVCICICCICCAMGILGRKKEPQVVLVQAPNAQPVVVG